MERHGRNAKTPGVRSGTVAAILVAALSGTASSWAGQAPPETAVVAGYERLRAAGDHDADALGELLLGELNCLSCHRLQAGPPERVSTKSAPDLRRIGRRAAPAWIRSFIEAPHRTKPGTTMPSALAGFDAAERERLAEDLTHFLVAQSDGAAPSPYAPFRFRAAIERGRDLYDSVGCSACHPPSEVATTSVSVPKGDLASKWNVEALAAFLLNPDSVRYGSRMPSLHLSAAEARDLAVYLLREQEPQRVEYWPGFEFEYFAHPVPGDPASDSAEGPRPDLAGLEPDGSGRINRLSLRLPITTGYRYHSYRFSGLLRIPAAGAYTVTLASDRDAASEIRLDGEVITAKARGAVRQGSAIVELSPGLRAIEVEYYRGAGATRPALDVTIAADSGDAVPLERLVVVEDIELAPPTSPAWSVDPEKAARGRRAFAAVGCAACHALGSAPTGIDTISPAPAVEEMTLSASGAWEHRAEGAPRYRLDSGQRSALAAALARPDRLATPRNGAAQITHTLATYGCYACHSRGSAGGPAPDRRPLFRAFGDQDLGNEGRFPPTLSRVGGKLKPEALAAVLGGQELHIRRETMRTRMPAFGGEMIAALPGLLDEVDAEPGDLDAPPVSPATVEDGRRLVGSAGLRCIACHDVGAAGTFGISMANLDRAHDRLRPGWLNGFLRDPGAINPDTRMPQYWVDDSVIFEDVAGGTTQGQIDAILAYLSLGTSMPVPEGMDLGESMVLVPTGEPIVFRTFMSEASPRAIAVGYPEGVHAAFDANVQRFVKLWRGGFFDAKGTWSGRAGQFFGPYGSEVLDLPLGPAIATLPTPEAPWPLPLLTDRDLGGEFRGYRFDDERRPIFDYVLDEVRISEQMLPVVSAGGTHFVRRFTLDLAGATEPYYLLAAEGAEIAVTGDDTWVVDGVQTVTVSATQPVAPRVRLSQGAAQLLIPIPAGSQVPMTIDVEIRW
jgi:cytochrome c2